MKSIGHKFLHLQYLEMEYEQIDELIKSEGKTHFVNRLRSKLIGRSVKVQGRSISDDQGMMFIAENMLEVPPEEWIKPDKIRDKWGLRGRTKYTHLTDQDTTQRDVNPWDATEVKPRFVSSTNPSFRPTKKAKKR